MAERAPDFSVVLPVHNGEAYIAQTIESVLQQTYPYLRLLILENASSDRTMAIIRSYDDPRLIVQPSDRLLSIEENWGRILDLDLDEYVTLISHDDLIYPEFLQSMVALIQAEPAASLYHSQYHLIDSEGRVLREALPSGYQESVREFMTAAHQFRREVVSVGYAMRSADFKQVGGLPPLPGLLYADMICWYRLTALSYKVYVPRPLAAFRQHAQSATRSSVLTAYYEASLRYLDAVQQIDPSRSEADAMLATRHIAKAFHLKQRQILADLIRGDSAGRFQDYRRERDKFVAIAAENPVFEPFDRYSRLLEGIASLPFDGVRRELLDGTEGVVALSRRLR